MKKLVLIFFCLLQLILFSNFANAATHKAYLKLADGVSRYVEYTPPLGNKPTIILVNGLVYELARWQPYSQPLIDSGFGVLNYYFRGQHLTLKKESQGGQVPAFFSTGLEVADFANELSSLVKELKLDGPFIVVGLSYGASIAAEFAKENPRQILQLILMAPLVQSLSNYDPTGLWLNWNLAALKMWWGPAFGPTFYEMAYRQIYKNFLNQRIAPERIPQELKDQPEVYRESIFHLVRALRAFNLKDYHFEQLATGSVHFLLAKEDNAAMFADQLTAYNQIQKRAQGNLIYLPQAHHAIPDSQGKAAALLTNMLIKKDSRLRPGQKYYLTSQGKLSPWGK